jgi:hypothetical protein
MAGTGSFPEITPPAYTPSPYEMTRPQEQVVGSKSFLMTISVVVGIVVGMGVIIGGIGKYVYVERPVYDSKMTEVDRSMVTTAEGIKNINQTQYRFEAALDRIERVLGGQSTDIQVIKIDLARRKH